MFYISFPSCISLVHRVIDLFPAHHQPLVQISFFNEKRKKSIHKTCVLPTIIEQEQGDTYKQLLFRRFDKILFL